MMSKNIEIEPYVFPSLAMATEHTKAVLHAHDLYDRIDGPDVEFLVNLFLPHPNKQTKVAGQGIDGFEVRPHKFRTRAFHLIRTDGTAVAFSYRKCLKA